MAVGPLPAVEGAPEIPFGLLGEVTGVCGEPSRLKVVFLGSWGPTTYIRGEAGTDGTVGVGCGGDGRNPPAPVTGDRTDLLDENGAPGRPDPNVVCPDAATGFNLNGESAIAVVEVARELPVTGMGSAADPAAPGDPPDAPPEPAYPVGADGGAAPP